MKAENWKVSKISWILKMLKNDIPSIGVSLHRSGEITQNFLFIIIFTLVKINKFKILCNFTPSKTPRLTVYVSKIMKNGFWRTKLFSTSPRKKWCKQYICNNQKYLINFIMIKFVEIYTLGLVIGQALVIGQLDVFLSYFALKL
jgi:hypothetical protein